MSRSELRLPKRASAAGGTATGGLTASSESFSGRDNCFLNKAQRVTVLDSIYEIMPSDRIHARENWGECSPTHNTILLDSALSGQKYEQVLIHEIIEAINFEYDIQMRHDVLTMLANALYLFLKQMKSNIKNGEIDIPAKVEIGFSCYDVVIDSSPLNHDSYIQSSFLQHFINLSQDITEPVRKCKYFMASVVGAMRYEYELKLSEHQLQLLSTGIAKFLRDNPVLFEAKNGR